VRAFGARATHPVDTTFGRFFDFCSKLCPLPPERRFAAELGGAGLVIEEGATLSLASVAFFFVGAAGVAGVVAVDVDVFGKPDPSPVAPNEITCAGGAFAEPMPARPINTPMPIASSNTPTPAISARLLLRELPGAPAIVGGGVGGFGGIGEPAGGCECLSAAMAAEKGPARCARGSPH
jgi:hypothetical protein